MDLVFNTPGRHAVTSAKTVSMFQVRDYANVLPHFMGSSVAANVTTNYRLDHMVLAFMVHVVICAICMMKRASIATLMPSACVTAVILGSTVITMITVTPHQRVKTVVSVTRTIGFIMHAIVLALAITGFTASCQTVTITVRMANAKWDDLEHQHATVVSGSRVTCAK